ncbi:MAG: hypothetical protein RPG89_18095 [Microcystis panniformis WG22]|nr:hypothetical protein [Microcystis panniformis WG22]
MSWLRFRMNLKQSDQLLTGKLSVMDEENEVKSFLATSGLPGWQKPSCQSVRRRGPIPACKTVNISNYSVRTTPFDERGVPGIEGNFYYIEPDPVIVPPARGEFGIHFDANVPGSAGCVVLRNRDEWEDFQDFMASYKRQGFPTISLIVEYNVPETPRPQDPVGTSYFTVTSPQPGTTLKTHESIEFSGTADEKVAQIIVTVGPGGPFKVAEVQPTDGKWSFSQTLVTPGVGRPFSFRAFDADSNLLQKIDFQMTLVSPAERARTIKLTGKMSTFGGPNDTGMRRTEGLALVNRYEELPDYFLRPPNGDEGLGRLLNPDKYYIACRWNYSVTPRRYLISTFVKVTNPKNGQSAEAKPVDWGPAEWTGRVADISPGLALKLGLETDDLCIVEIPFSEN